MWMQRLYETYENCSGIIGKEKQGEAKLLPICHSTQKAQIAVTVDINGEFESARVLTDDMDCLIPVSQESATRSGSKPSAHPLCDKLQYVAGDFVDYGGEVTSGFKDEPTIPFEQLRENLKQWCSSAYGNDQLKAILTYLDKKCLLEDLAKAGVIHLNENQKFAAKKDFEELPEIFSVLANDKQDDAFVVWRVHKPGSAAMGTWEDEELWESWSNYYCTTLEKRGFCYANGTEQMIAQLHPNKLRNTADKAKIISSKNKYVYVGRFSDVTQAAAISYEYTQKLHGALRWLIARQGVRLGEGAVFLCWSVSGEDIAQCVTENDPFSSGEEEQEPDTARAYAAQIQKRMHGYYARLKDTAAPIVCMTVDAATTGRLAINYYSELPPKDYFERMERWYAGLVWRQFSYDINNKKWISYIGTPTPKDISFAAFGSLDGKQQKRAIMRLLPCIMENGKIPRDILDAAMIRATKKNTLEGWEWEKTLGIACAMYRKNHIEEGFEMALDEKRNTRDYLYGRLLAAADCMEEFVLWKNGDRRPTNATKYFTRFAQRPFTTWRSIDLSLSVYRQKMEFRSNKYDNAIAQTMELFDTNNFTDDSPLSGEFLIAYYCQRDALRFKHKEEQDSQETETQTI